MTNTELKYKGKSASKPPYLVSEELKEAVNQAIYLERPLLIKGEPGCGKTKLAKAVADELNLPYQIWRIKSTSRALDGLYTYDAVRRLRDAQLAGAGAIKIEELKQFDDPMEYVRWGPLGKAFQSTERTVVLIDEIDKADIDFPNDLLAALEDNEFEIEETGKTIKAKVPPIVFVTSNDEKDLPEAFLRRCLFHYIHFPSPERLKEIVNAHFPDSPQKLVDATVEKFWKLRQFMAGKIGEAEKKVSTSELLDWYRMLYRYGEVEALKKLEGDLPFPGVLLKTWNDHLRYLKMMKQGGDEN